ncbi:replication initiator protein A [Streptococcus suis]
MQFDPITASQYETTERYYELPKALFENELYRDMRLDVKVSYAILKDRLKLSIKNGWIDDDGIYYLIYSNSKLMKILDCSKSTLLRIKKQLAEYGLMREVQQSSSKEGTLANRIYLGNLHVSERPAPAQNNESSTPVSNLDQGGVKNRLGGCQIDTGRVSESAPNEPEYSEPNNSEYSSSRKSETISDEIPPSPQPNFTLTRSQSEKYIPPKYYSLLQTIADRYNGKFCQIDLFTGETQNYNLTHKQKMMIGQYLDNDWVTSQEVLDMIDRVPVDCESPLAYLLKMLENLKIERQAEVRRAAHLNAQRYYEGGQV